jgi:hypothetical protein
LVTMVFLLDPSGFITWRRSAFISRTKSRPVAPLRPDLGFAFELVVRVSFTLFSS